jgi:hypothetical protein
MTPGNVSSAGVGLSAAGGVVGAIGSIFGGQSQQKMFNYQAALAQQNAQIAKQNADYAIQQGEQQAQSYGMQAAQRQGQIKVAQAASGLDINSGSAARVQAGQKLVTSMDLDQIRSNAAKTAYNYDVQANTFENQSSLDVMAGSNAAAAGEIGATSTLLGSASSVSTKWLQGQQAGLFGSP